MLMHLADSAELFHTATGTAHADLAIDGHRETWPVRGPRFRAWLRRRYHEATGDALNAAALNANDGPVACTEPRASVNAELLRRFGKGFGMREFAQGGGDRSR